MPTVPPLRLRLIQLWRSRVAHTGSVDPRSLCNLASAHKHPATRYGKLFTLFVQERRVPWGIGAFEPDRSQLRYSR